MKTESFLSNVGNANETDFPKFTNRENKRKQKHYGADRR